MRLFLLAASVLIATPALAATQAANPVEPFLNGKVGGTASNPLFAALSLAIPAAGAATQAGAPVELFSYGRRVGTQSNPLYINCPTCAGGSGGDYTLPAATSSTLGGVKIGSGVNVTTDGTISVALPDLSQYLTTSAASTTYLPLSSSATVTAHAPTLQYYFAGANGGYNYIRGTSNNSFDIGFWESTSTTGLRILTQNGTAFQVNDKIYADLAVQNSAIPTANPGTNSHFVCVDDAGDFFRSDTACQ